MSYKNFIKEDLRLAHKIISYLKFDKSMYYLLEKEYQKIIKSMPIFCIDFLISFQSQNEKIVNEILHGV